MTRAKLPYDTKFIYNTITILRQNVSENNYKNNILDIWQETEKLSFNALYIHINISRNLNNLDTYHKLINKLEENGIENCFDSPNTLYVNNYI